MISTGCARCVRTQTSCSYCKNAPVVDARSLAASAPRVRAALSQRGVHIRQEVSIELRSRAAIARGVPTASANVVGLARYARDGQGRVVGTQRLTIRHGLPLVEFEACLAHELTHLALIEAGATELPDVLNEGMAEFVAHRYLVADVGARFALDLARAMQLRSGDVYGDGLRTVTRSVDRVGFEQTWNALVSGRYQLGAGRDMATGS